MRRVLCALASKFGMLCAEGFYRTVLASLHIRNLAVVDAAVIEFAPGLNVLTGETGAGKSLVIGALQLLLGERAGPHLIRSGAERCELAAEIVLPEDPGLLAEINAVLDEAGAPPPEDGRILLRRVVTPTSSRAFLNDAPVTLGMVRRLGDLLVDLHGPHEHQSLLRSACMRELLDRAASLQEMVAACREAWTLLRRRSEELAALEAEAASPEQVSMLEAQLAEIEGAGLSEDDEELFDRYTAASRARELIEKVDACRRLLNDEEDSAVERLAAAVRLLHEASEMDGREVMAGLLERLESVVETVHDLSADLADYCDSVEVDPVELARMEERLNLLHRLRRKYGRTVQDILETAERIRSELDAVEGRGKRLEELRAEVAAARAEHEALCRRLHDGREKAAAILGKQVTKKLHRLAFTGARFEVRVTPAEPGPDGADSVEFMFAPAPDAPLQPLRRIASSGEAARIMLAIKTVLGAADRIPILVFDEVDANVGGRAATSVVEELRAVAEGRQVLCITHLPLIAAAADHHLRVAKSLQDGRTTAEVRPLSETERLRELVRMLGAPEDSETALAHAEELLAGACCRRSTSTAAGARASDQSGRTGVGGAVQETLFS